MSSTTGVECSIAVQPTEGGLWSVACTCGWRTVVHEYSEVDGAARRHLSMPNISRPMRVDGATAAMVEPSNPMALGAGITGIVSLFALFVPFFWLLAVPGTLVALILGIVAKQRPGRKGWATTGIVTGVIGLIVGIIAMVGVVSAVSDLSDTLNSGS
jgi:hypothetical protein